jgi:hypothetical protein
VETDLSQGPRDDSLNDSSSLFIEQMDLIDDQELYFLIYQLSGLSY